MSVLKIEKRESTFYAYIKKENKTWLEDQAKKAGCKVSPWFDAVVDLMRAKAVKIKVRPRDKRSREKRGLPPISETLLG